MKSGIYKITNLVNGKFYIGSSKNIEDRWINGHKNRLKRQQHPNPILQNAWNFYGEDKFQMDIIEETTSDEFTLLEREQHWLDLLKPYIRNIGYNICPTAAGGDNITYNPNRDSFIEKMSHVTEGENNPMFGKHHTEKSKQLQKDKALGRFTLEWFIKKYGEEDGKIKYIERKNHLSQTKFVVKPSIRPKINYTKEFGNSIRKSKERMKTMKIDLINDIKCQLYSIKGLAEKYNLSKSVIKYYKKKIKNGEI